MCSRRELGQKNFDIMLALTTTDEEFCKHFSINPQNLATKKQKKAYIEEKD